jgi:hypothetical protein
MDSITKYKNFIIAIIIIAIFVLAGKAMFIDYISKSTALDVKRTAVANEKDFVNRWEIATLEYDSKAVKFFRKDPALFKRFVEDTAQSCSVALTSLATSKKEEGLAINVRLNIKMQASYKNFLQFIKALEEKNISIEHITIGKKSGNVGILEEDVILNAPVLKE